MTGFVSPTKLSMQKCVICMDHIMNKIRQLLVVSLIPLAKLFHVDLGGNRRTDRCDFSNIQAIIIMHITLKVAKQPVTALNNSKGMKNVALKSSFSIFLFLCKYITTPIEQMNPAKQVAVISHLRNIESLNP